MKNPSALSDETRKRARPRRGRAWRRWLKPLTLIAAALLLQTIAHRNPQLVERYYSRGIFPRIGRMLSLINNLVGFSIAEVMIYVLPAALLIALVYQAGEIYFRRKRLGDLLKNDLLILLWITASGIMLFLLLWGFNYQRVPLRSSLSASVQNVSVEQTKRISETIVNELISNYDQSHNTQTGYVPPSRAQVNELIESSYEQEALLREASHERSGRAKPIYFSGVMSRLGLSGFYMPFTGEPNFNAAQPDFDLPYVIAHEKAHQRGFAREDEANFLAFIVCINSPDPFVRYSGYLNVLRVVSAFVSSDPEYYRGLFTRIAEGPRNDLRARAAFWARYQGPARAVAFRVNNSYLKANRIGSGAESYEEDVALIVAYYLTKAGQGTN
jgi:hypothetical protein